MIFRATVTAQPAFDFSVARYDVAAVVLQIEVLETSDPSGIEIDAASGSRQVNQAAADYARIPRRYADHLHGARRHMWIRWGVRLQA